MKIWMTFGTFDILHPWHIWYLSEAKKNCDFLITIIARDINVKKIKWFYPINDENTRLKNIKNLNIANQVVLWDKNDFWKTIKKFYPNIIFLWYDQKISENIKQLCKKLNIKLQIVPPFQPNIYKSSKLKKIFTKKQL